MVNVKGFQYEQSTPAYLKQGVKNKKTPKGAIGGGNGSFIMSGEPPKAIFIIEENGVEKHVNVYSMIKANSNRRVTEKYCAGIAEAVNNGEYKTLEDLNEAIIGKCE